MSREFRNQLIDFYAEQSPDQRIVDRLTRLCEIDGRSEGQDAHAMRASLIGSRLAIAATVVAALGAGWLLGSSQSQFADAPIVASLPEHAPLNVEPDRIDVPFDAPFDADDPRIIARNARHPGVCCLMSPRLVAVMVRKENCPRSVVVSPEFARLSSKYVDEPVMFVALDVSDAECLEKSREIAALMGFKELFESPVESGTVKLIDRQSGKLIASCKQADKMPDWEEALALALPHDR